MVSISLIRIYFMIRKISNEKLIMQPILLISQSILTYINFWI